MTSEIDKQKEFFEKQELELEKHKTAPSSKNVCYYLWLPEMKILKAIKHLNQGKEDGLMSEEKVGFKALNTWFLLLEEAIFLYNIKKIIVMSFQDPIPDDIKIINDEISLAHEKFIEIESLSKLYLNFFENPLYYERLHISVMYNFFRRKGFFLKRTNLNIIQQEIENLSGNPKKKNKKEKTNLKDEELEILNKINNQGKIPLFFLYKDLKSLQNNIIDSVLIVQKMEDEINENFIAYNDLMEHLPFNFKLVFVESQDVIILEIEKNFNII